MEPDAHGRAAEFQQEQQVAGVVFCFASLAENQYFLYEMIFSREQVRRQFEKSAGIT